MFIKVFRVVNWCHFSWTVILNVLFVDFLLVTVATNETDGFRRFIRSTKVYNIPVKVRYTWYPGLSLPLRRCGNVQLEVLEMFGSRFCMLSCGHLNTYKVPGLLTPFGLHGLMSFTCLLHFSADSPMVGLSFCYHFSVCLLWCDFWLPFLPILFSFSHFP